MHTVAVIVGSLRRESINLRFAKTLARIAEPTLALQLVDMGQPEVYFQTKPGLLGDDFAVTDEKTREFLGGFIAKLAAHAAT